MNIYLRKGIDDSEVRELTGPYFIQAKYSLAWAKDWIPKMLCRTIHDARRIVAPVWNLKRPGWRA